MDIILAGYNLDYETIRGMEDAHLELTSLTPETVSAAYARISRSPKPVNELRAIARTEVEKARQSNNNIVFEMGHNSIAEHAVFNIDVIGVSRLLVEEIEFTKHPDLAADPRNQAMLEGWAKEDARYILSMATQTQLGMTINARNLELVMRRMAAHPLVEANEYGRKLYDVVKPIAPSLIRYTEKTDYNARTGQDLRDKLAGFLDSLSDAGDTAPPAAVTLVHTTPDADDRVLAAFIHTATRRPFSHSLKTAAALAPDRKAEIFRTAFRHMQGHDAAPRELECVDLTYDLIVSASCFAQLKRHRMATLLCQSYDPSLGVTIPESIQEVGMTAAFQDMIGQTEDFYNELQAAAPTAADYALTNAHRKRVLMKINARELYHIARLRADRHAQWDIRNLAKEMIARAQTVMPLTLMLATGKDDFADRRMEIYRD
ncbi:MAG: FAD-dependent thymidylate synthase [Syntrophales bacterium]|nr:FAD-dependent thymidylate synthase [Syntrophales bacterium]